jgi:hypothetical protein
MPIVQVKGVANPMQFPDDMGIDDIREFLRKRFANMAATGESNVNLDPRQATAQAYDPTLTERAGQGIAGALKSTGLVSDNYGAQRIGENLASIGEVLPGIGDAAAGDEFGRALKTGDGFGIGMAALGAIPIAGDVAKKALREPKYITLPSGGSGADKFRKIKAIDPNATAKANPDGSVGVAYLDEYQPTKIKEYLYEFDPDALELSESGYKNTNTYKGDKKKPIAVTKENGNYIILDGHHRAKIAKEEGQKVKAVVIPINDVVNMQKNNIHQADMFKEWVATRQSQPMQ